MFYICIVVNTESENSDQGQIPAEEKESDDVPESPIPDLPPRSHRTLSVSIAVQFFYNTLLGCLVITRFILQSNLNHRIQSSSVCHGNIQNCIKNHTQQLFRHFCYATYTPISVKVASVKHNAWCKLDKNFRFLHITD